MVKTKTHICKPASFKTCTCIVHTTWSQSCNKCLQNQNLAWHQPQHVRSSKKMGPILQICMFITGIDKILALAEDCLMQRHTEDTKACSSHNQSSSVTNCKLCNSLCYSMQACFIGRLSDMYLSGKHCSCWGCCTCTAVEHESFHYWSEWWIVELI